MTGEVLSVGHASSRIGWAIVSNPALADAMQEYVSWHGNIPIENQARAAALLEHVARSQGDCADIIFSVQ